MATSIPDQSYDTPNITAASAGLVVHSTTRIAAPASLVFRTLRNTETWKDWNQWVPRVNITHQPPDEDLATAAEINELVRNTSIAGSIDSDLTEGLSGGGSVPKPRLSESGDPLPTPALKLRSKSVASGMSARSGSEASEHGRLSTSKNPSLNGLSGAQKYALAQEERRSSIASGETPTVPSNNIAVAPSTVPVVSNVKGKGRKGSVDDSVRKAKTGALLILYGEPSVRIQLNTKMTIYPRMDPSNPREFKPIHLIVTEVSRPDDPVMEGTHLTALTRSKTHTLSRSPVYRVVWAMDHSMSSFSTIKAGSSFPKSMLTTERVHEIRPIYLGDGSEECEYRSWECQKGPLARVVKKKYGDFIQKQFEKWGLGIKEFTEALGGKVDRRDFEVEKEVESVW